MSEFYPFAPRESQLEEYREDARRSFSRIGWACFAMMLVMQGGAALLMLGCQLLAMRGSRFMIAFIQSEWFQWVIIDAANYGLGLPVLLLILRPMPLPPAPPRLAGVPWRNLFKLPERRKKRFVFVYIDERRQAPPNPRIGAPEIPATRAAGDCKQSRTYL